MESPIKKQNCIAFTLIKFNIKTKININYNKSALQQHLQQNRLNITTVTLTAHFKQLKRVGQIE